MIGGTNAIAASKVDVTGSHTKNVYVKGSAGCNANFVAACRGKIMNSYAIDGIVIGGKHAGGFKSCDVSYNKDTSLSLIHI